MLTKLGWSVPAYLHGFPNASIVREKKRPPPCKTLTPRRPLGCLPNGSEPEPSGKLDLSPVLNPNCEMSPHPNPDLLT